MCKSADRSMIIGDLALWEKTGGRSGVWRRPAGDLALPLVNSVMPTLDDIEDEISELVDNDSGESPNL
jgi:hypothetical protein